MNGWFAVSPENAFPWDNVIAFLQHHYPGIDYARLTLSGLQSRIKFIQGDDEAPPLKASQAKDLSPDEFFAKAMAGEIVPDEGDKVVRPDDVTKAKHDELRRLFGLS